MNKILIALSLGLGLASPIAAMESSQDTATVDKQLETVRTLREQVWQLQSNLILIKKVKDTDIIRNFRKATDAAEALLTKTWPHLDKALANLWYPQAGIDPIQSIRLAQDCLAEVQKYTNDVANVVAPIAPVENQPPLKAKL